jgi:type I restriction enzyme R subunit
MATGTGKTYTAFQIIWRLWKSKARKRILYLADRNILIDQTKTNDFKPFGAGDDQDHQAQVDKSFEIYLSLYQAVTGNEEDKNIYKQFSPTSSTWSSSTNATGAAPPRTPPGARSSTTSAAPPRSGLTATPKETKDVSNIHYFGDPVYTYSLKQGIEDGFLAPTRSSASTSTRTCKAGDPGKARPTSMAS